MESLTAPLVSVDWLSRHREDVVVVDCRFSLADPELGRSQYAEAHIPGAHYLHLNDDLSGPLAPDGRGGRHPLPDAAAFTAKLRSLGIGPEMIVIAYDASRFAFAARFWWLMRALGHRSVAVLDGGWDAWVAARLPMLSGLPDVEATARLLAREPLETSGPSSRLASPLASPLTFWRPAFEGWVTIEQVKRRGAQEVLVDSRSPERYRGEVEPIDPIAGHIPGAVNAFWQGVTDGEGLALPQAAQRDRWKQMEPAIASGEVPVTVYCGSGVTACVNLLSLALADLPAAQLYAGSWSDWCADLRA